jgi:hypothetical protein
MSVKCKIIENTDLLIKYFKLKRINMNLKLELIEKLNIINTIQNVDDFLKINRNLHNRSNILEIRRHSRRVEKLIILEHCYSLEHKEFLENLHSYLKNAESNARISYIRISLQKILPASEVCPAIDGLDHLYETRWLPRYGKKQADHIFIWQCVWLVLRVWSKPAIKLFDRVLKAFGSRA